MSFSFSTGSEAVRDIEILRNWFVFEGMTDERFSVSGGIYSVPLGQDRPADYYINTGSVVKDGDYLLIEKTRYVFDHEVDATRFLTDIGSENITAYYEKRFMVRPGEFKTQYVAEVINFPTFDLEVTPVNYEIFKGFRADVYQEDGSALVKMDREIIENDVSILLTEPFLRYFDLEDDS